MSASASGLLGASPSGGTGKDGAMDAELWLRWSADVGPGPASRRAFDDVCRRYAEPHRHYHTLVHVLRVLRSVGELLAASAAAGAPVHGDDAAAVRLAAWFHDAVYDPRSATNETESAAYAARVLDGLGWPAHRVALVGELVLATATHSVAGPTTAAIATAVLLDADLAVLAADPATYQAYVDGVRSEYVHLDDETWRTGRSAVLRQLAGRPALFHVPPTEGRERAARANLAAELARWSGPGSR